jgi:hypothetical protein
VFISGVTTTEKKKPIHRHFALWNRDVDFQFFLLLDNFVFFLVERRYDPIFSKSFSYFLSRIKEIGSDANFCPMFCGQDM